MTESNGNGASEGVIEGELVPFEPRNKGGGAPKFTPERRAELTAEADKLNVEKGMGVRKIAALFTSRGEPVSHVTVARWLDDARAQRPFLEALKVADIRSAQMDRLEWYTQMLREAVESATASVTEAMPHLLKIEQLIVTVAGTAAPKQLEVKNGNGSGPKPDPETLRALAALAEAEREDEDG